MENEFEKGFMAGFLINQRKSDEPDVPTDEKWKYPSNWLSLPNIGDGEVAALIFVPKSENVITIMFSNDAESVDWGDPDDPDDQNKQSTHIHGYTYDRGTPYSEEFSMFVLKAKFSNGTFRDISTGFGYIAAFAINDSAMDSTTTSGQIVYGNNRKYLKYIKFTGNMTNFEKRSQSIFDYPSLKRVDFEKSPTKLPEYAFGNCNSLTSINLPDLSAVENASNRCFTYCRALDKITLPLLKTAGDFFCSWCQALHEVNLPNLETIGDAAFKTSLSINTLSLPVLSSAGDEFMYGCYGIKTVNLPVLTTFGSYAFYYNYSLKNINIPSIETVGNYLFYNCTSLNSVDLSTLQSIGDYAFYNCYGIESIDLNALTTITNNRIGLYCYALSKLNMPNIDKTGSNIFPQSYLIK